MKQMLEKIIVAIATIAVLALCGMALSSCSAAKQYVATVEIYSTGVVRPTSLVRTSADLDVVVAWGEGVFQAGVFQYPSGMYILGPVTKPQDRVLVIVRSKDIKWEGTLEDMLPREASSLFTSNERSIFGLKFQ